MPRLPDKEFWKDRKVLLTGHTGFKGAWASLWLSRLGAHVTGLALSPEGAPNLFTMAKIADCVQSNFADLRDLAAVRRIVKETRPEIVIHMAAQALVKASIDDPLGTIGTNVLGTAHLLEALREASDCRTILVVTSDKVYANDDLGRAFREDDPLGGKDPYSASKAAAEIIVASYAKTFFQSSVAVATARGGNVIGGGDYSANRLVPDIVRAVAAGEAVVLRHPEATRPWQHVLDCVGGYLCYVEALHGDGGVQRQMNFGPSDASEVTVAELTGRALAAIDNKAGSWRHEPVPGSVEAKLLAVDATRAAEVLGFSCRLDKAAAVDWTMRWYGAVAAGNTARDLTLSQIADYGASPH